MTKAAARARCRAQMKIIAAWAKEQRMKRLLDLKEEVERKKVRAREECARLVAGASLKPKAKKKAAPKKRAPARPRKRAAAPKRRRIVAKPRKAAPKARKRAPKRKAARKGKSGKKASSRGSPAAVERRAEQLAYEHVIDRIRNAVRSGQVKRFGEKAFIGSVWQQLRRSEPFKSMGRDEFNQLLLHAHREGDLRMSRADLVSAMNRKDVDDSEIAYLNATFHFLNP